MSRSLSFSLSKSFCSSGDASGLLYFSRMPFGFSALIGLRAVFGSLRKISGFFPRGTETWMNFLGGRRELFGRNSIGKACRMSVKTRCFDVLVVDSLKFWWLRALVQKGSIPHF